MKLIFLNYRAVVLLIHSIILLSICLPLHANQSIAFFYGRPVPVNLLSHYKQVVVEPDNMDNLDDLHAKGTNVFAYISIGEIHPTRSWYSEIPQSWILGSNEKWGSRIIDLTQQGWHDYLINKYLSKLWKEGYRGFFLDTMDSYQSAVHDADGRVLQEKALASLISRIHQHFPGVKLIFNRGFEVLPEVGRYAVALAAESLFEGWDPAKQDYTEVKEADRHWLLDKLRQTRDQYGLQIIVIDYVDPKQRELARKTAKRISDLGFTPWVATPRLDILGVGLSEIFSRRILALYDGQEYPEGLQQTDVHKLLAMPLEYMGYTIDYLDVNSGLPTQSLIGQYAGIVTWFNNDNLRGPINYRDWLLSQIDSGIKIAILGNLGFKANHTFLQHFQVKLSQSAIKEPLKIERSDQIIGYEVKPQPKTRGFTIWQASGNIDTHLSLIDQNKQSWVAVFTGQWGGVAFHPYVIETGYEGRQRWIIDPFKFLTKALDLPEIPVPDVTTENGRRLLLVQIDGDGSSNKAEIPGTPLTIKVIQDYFLKKYKLPSTVSIIEGEASNGNSTDRLTEVEKVARNIFDLNNVEIASHSYSHPSTWFPKNNIDARGDDFNFSIPDYKFSLEREIAGSVNYINKKLASEKKQVRVFFWTGDGLADKEALTLTHSLGLENMNGGGATISKDEKTMTRVPPLGYAIGDQFQVYAPIASEHVFTNSWQGPFYGFNRVIETMQLTDSPLRLKPLHIHYHFYSGSKIASINALQSVYDWSIKQEPRAIWVSEYAQKVNEFRSITLSRRIDGTWDIRGLNKLRTLRLPVSLGWPDLENSEGIIGVRDIKQGRYVHLLPNHGQALLNTTSELPSSTYLLHSNGEIGKWQKTAEGANLHVHAHMPLELVIASLKRKCYINWRDGKLDGQQQNRSWKFVFPITKLENASLVCH
ncbi:bifunctional glycoside hydrolase 114/ polysaccharide deacetylase family protein [Nitrosomonas sp. Nm34]|uniref:bifunctional glycoside hydrolase 114/ polysaccharide deacetylase family protein n=1 Tax=Nitrosomonas sp. Nm34 TaxID=1881055 RepID=UPI0008ED1382|nr:endo alpha-1,4 polygalactosaminidase [Nitrosomonas sp. Nm34]SFI63188.1 extracellular protein [Nitrosomonas sp. Nm34]